MNPEWGQLSAHRHHGVGAQSLRVSGSLALRLRSGLLGKGPRGEGRFIAKMAAPSVLWTELRGGDKNLPPESKRAYRAPDFKRPRSGPPGRAVGECRSGCRLGCDVGGWCERELLCSGFFPLWGICWVFRILHFSREPFRVLLSNKCVQNMGWPGL